MTHRTFRGVLTTAIQVAYATLAITEYHRTEVLTGCMRGIPGLGNQA